MISVRVTRADISLARRRAKAYERSLKRRIHGSFNYGENCPVAIAVQRAVPCDRVSVFGSYAVCDFGLTYVPSPSIYPQFDAKKLRRFRLDTAGLKIMHDYDDSLTARPAIIQLKEDPPA